MAKVQPFHAIRYNLTQAGNPADLVSPPLHAMDARFLQTLRARSPHNVIHLAQETPAGPEGMPAGVPRSRCPLFRLWLERGVLKRDRDPALYLYEQSYATAAGRLTRRGFFAAVPLQAHQDQPVRPHVRCRADKTAGWLQVLRTVQANLDPVILLYDDPQGLVESVLVNASHPLPDLALTSEARVEHRLFCLTDPAEIAAIVTPLEGKSLWIAGNHAGYEAALAYQEIQRAQSRDIQNSKTIQPYDCLLAFLSCTSDPATTMSLRHRVIHDLTEFSFARFIRQLGEYFDLEPLQSLRDIGQMRSALREAGREKPAFVILGGGAVGRRTGYLVVLDLARSKHRLSYIPGPPAWAHADEVVLEELILRDILGIVPGTPEGDAHFSYVDEAEALLQAGRSKENQLVVMTNEISLATLQVISQKGGCLPEEATRFFPEPLSGLVFHDLTGLQ